MPVQAPCGVNLSRCCQVGCLRVTLRPASEPPIDGLQSAQGCTAAKDLAELLASLCRTRRVCTDRHAVRADFLVEKKIPRVVTAALLC
jgi:hypothetical protein